MPSCALTQTRRAIAGYVAAVSVQRIAINKYGKSKMADAPQPRRGRGRPPGAVNQAKRELAEMAKDKAERALQVLAEIMESGESDAARVSAANSILDRGYGKPSQAMQIGGDPENPLPAAIAVHFVKPDGQA